MARAAPVIGPLQACTHCLSSRQIAGGLYCMDAEVRGPAAAVPCSQARERHGGCGWEAKRLHWPAINVQPRVATPQRAAA